MYILLTVVSYILDFMFKRTVNYIYNMLKHILSYDIFYFNQPTSLDFPRSKTRTTFISCDMFCIHGYQIIVLPTF